MSNLTINQQHVYSYAELRDMDTIEQAWDGDELKLEDEDEGIRVWLVSRENRPYNGDFVVETRVNGKWFQDSYYFITY